MEAQAQVVETPKSSVLVSILCIGGILLGSMVMDNSPVIKCSASSPIAEILSIEDSDATVKLGNGKIITIDNARIKKGDNFCLAYSRE